MLRKLAKALDEGWNELKIRFAEPWETSFVVRAGIRDDYELYLLEKGQGIFSVDGREYALSRGDVILLRTNVENSFAPLEEEAEFRFDFVTFSLEQPGPARRELDRALAEEKGFCLRPANREDIQALMYRLQKSFLLRGEGSEFEGKLLLGSLVQALLAPEVRSGAQGTAQGRGRSSAKYVNHIVDYLQENYEKPISLEELGQLVGLHPRYLSSLYAEYTGRTIWETLLAIRLERAKKMLLSTDRSVTDIAMDTGFGDSQYFSRRFAAAEGISPRAYRKANRGA